MKRWADTSDIVILASGTLAIEEEVPGGNGRMSFRPWRCAWAIQVPSGCLEPDSPADLWKIVDCGAKVKDHPVHPGQGWRCEAGHEHIEYQVWAEAGHEARYAFEEEQAERRGEYRQAASVGGRDDYGRDVW